ncbi:MAG TPA: hypothetical protein PKH31_10835 [Candidatus Sumerlaeota bacterium]|nr:hypothetical protein [Candidatus Sumerlaeota bacterium]
MRSPILVFLLLLFLYLLTFGGHFYSPDEEVMFRVTEALATRGSLAIDPITEGFATRPAQPPRPDGREYAQYGVGQPIAAAPFYWLGRALQPLASDEAWVFLDSRLRTIQTIVAPRPALPQGAALALEAQGLAARLGVSLFNTVLTAFSGMVLFLLARRLTRSERAAWLAALAWGAGSMAWPHARTFFSEAFAGLCQLLAFLALALCFFPKDETGESPETPVRQGRGAWLCFAAGLAAGYGCLVRLDSVLFLPVLALLVAYGYFPITDFLGSSVRVIDLVKALGRHLLAPGTEGKARPVFRLIAFCVPVGLAGGAILAMNWLQYGSLLASGYSDQSEGIQFSTPILAGLYGFTMSIGKGLFFFSPALFLALWGIGPMLRRQPVFGAAVLANFILFLCAMSCWRNWAGGWCWGPRHIMQIHALLAVPIAFWVAEGWNGVRRMLFSVLMVVAVAVQVYGCSQSFFEFYHAYFRDPAPPNAHILYDPENEMFLASCYAVYRRDPQTGQVGERVPLGEILRAPINDSIYIVQNSQWTGYAELWRTRGVHDFFWVHVLE